MTYRQIIPGILSLLFGIYFIVFSGRFADMQVRGWQKKMHHTLDRGMQKFAFVLTGAGFVIVGVLILTGNFGV
jgi:hypothetical protein